jgi:hypothetical protein
MAHSKKLISEIKDAHLDMGSLNIGTLRFLIRDTLQLKKYWKAMKPRFLAIEMRGAIPLPELVAICRDRKIVGQFNELTNNCGVIENM